MHHFKLYYQLRCTTWPRYFIMDMLEETCWQAREFQDWNLFYLHCIDLSYLFELTVPSLPFLKLNCVFAHVSFPGSLLERQMVVIPRSNNHLRKIEDMNSPCVIEVISSVNFKVNTSSVYRTFVNISVCFSTIDLDLCSFILIRLKTTTPCWCYGISNLTRQSVWTKTDRNVSGFLAKCKHGGWC